jgi:hypothetical protein
MSHSLSVLRQFHEAALESLHALVRLHDLVLRYGRLHTERRSPVRVDVLYHEYIVPVMKGLGKIAGIPEHGSSFESMTAARLALGRDLVAFHGMPAPNAHALVFGVAIIFVRLWNRHAQPTAPEIPPPIDGGTWEMVLRAPNKEMDLTPFLDQAHQSLHDSSPLPLHAELELEYVKAAETIQAEERAGGECIRCAGGVWHLRYQEESREYPVRGNQGISWLAKLLVTPNRLLTVADLRGDPELKLAADAMLMGVKEVDRRTITDIRKRLEEINDTAEETGWSKALEDEKLDLLAQLKGPLGKKLRSSLKRDHANIATQLRNLMKKLKAEMPQLAAHLKASLKLNYPDFGYYPPDPPPAWQV